MNCAVCSWQRKTRCYDSGMHVLVTGGAGFIGSHLVDALVSRSHRVTVLDDLSSGKFSNLSSPDSVTFIEGDVADRDAVEQALSGVEAVVHLAAVASVQASVDNPLATSKTNLTGTIQLLDAAARTGVRQVLFAGSAAVYGDQKLAAGEALNESARTAPQTPYAIDKLAGEQYLAYYHAAGLLQGTGFRFFNIYGPRQDPSSPYSGVISIFHDRLAAGQPITVFGDGQQTRDFFYVGDLVKLLVQRLEGAGETGSRMPIVNVGSGKATSLLQLVTALAEVLAVDPQVSFGPARTGDIRHSLTETTALSRMFGKEDSTSLLDGLRLLAADS